MKRITSADNPGYKALLRLAHSSRERRKAGLSLLDGIHLITAYREHVGLPEQIAISATAAGRKEIQELLTAVKPLEALLLTDALFGTLSTVDTPTGVVAAIKTPRPTIAAAETESCVMLEDIQDPGNLGSILRTAAAAGFRQVYLSKGSVHAWSPRVLRAGMGAHFMLQIIEQADLLPLARDFNGTVIATARQAKKTVFSLDLTGRIAFLFGNEGAGLSKSLAGAAQVVAVVPMPGKIESLNVAAAAAICVFERVRQLQAGVRPRAIDEPAESRR